MRGRGGGCSSTAAAQVEARPGPPAAMQPHRNRDFVESRSTPESLAVEAGANVLQLNERSRCSCGVLERTPALSRRIDRRDADHPTLMAAIETSSSSTGLAAT